MVGVESEAICEVDYDPATFTMFVLFTAGGWYSYSGVSETAHRAFLAAESHGRFFHEHIRDCFPYRKGR